ncbi:MAG TPA: UbiD family decarboxylase [Syntrophorhabdales bacterium]|nr:UbiD family decarboxylase [Syntrophorhabdales bacterium]
MSIEKQDLRAVLHKIEQERELVRVKRSVDPLIEIPAVVKALARLPKIPALLFESVKKYPGVRACGAFFGDRSRVLRSLDLPMEPIALNSYIVEALEKPLAPRLVTNAPCKENVRKSPVDLGKIIFPTKGASQSKHLYYHTVVFTKHPRTGRINMGMYRVTLQPRGKVTVNLRVTQHGGMHLQVAKEINVPLQVALCLGVHPSIYEAATSELPYGYDEVGLAGALVREPVEMVKAETVDMLVPAHAEVVVEGEIRPPYKLGNEGPWPEYLGYLGMNINPPLMDVTAITFRNNPVVPIFVPGAIPNVVSIGNEAQLLRTLRSFAGEFVVDAAFTHGARRHHAVIKVRKTHPHHEGYQLNVAMAAFGHGSSTALDQVTIVDEDIDIRNYREVDWAVSTRCNFSKQVHILPEARSHQNNPIAGVRELSEEPIITGKMIVDATIPWAYRVAEKSPGITFFTRSSWPEVDLGTYLQPEDKKRWLK